MTYHPFRKSADYENPNCGECGLPPEHDVHNPPVVAGSELAKSLDLVAMPYKTVDSDVDSPDCLPI